MPELLQRLRDGRLRPHVTTFALHEAGMAPSTRTIEMLVAKAN